MAGVRGCNPLLAHIKQQPVVDIVHSDGQNNNDRAKNKVFITLNILKEKEEMDNGDQHNEEIKH